QMALKHTPDDEGIKTMEKAMENAFAKIGIVKIQSVGEILNPQFHNAIQMIDKPDENTATNTILEEMQSGYMFGDVVLRTAMVVVSK
ncbi:MAG: nucleotide exchange factor GrpE, partial [Alphaproteobacteria bacterium]|nr:nucleotide exchange factor GrpE [Alphaproteobacteria bacterium]